MIVAVEGPSAAGKTTWCARHAADDLVAEYQPTGREPAESDPLTRARYWASVNSGRWSQALAVEASTGRAVCDGDPLKLHYAWGLRRLGVAAQDSWEHELAATREAIGAGRLGFVDVVLICVPSDDVLRRRRDGDPTRRRSRFELHRRLGVPLREWYEALDRLEPGRVMWNLPPDGVPSSVPPPRPARSDPARLDALLAALPR